MSYYSRLVDMGALAYWPLVDDGSEVINGYDLTPTSVTYEADNPLDESGSADFDGSTTYLTSSNAVFDDLLPNDGSTFVSVGAWIKVDAMGSNKFQRIISKGTNTGSADYGWCFGVKEGQFRSDPGNWYPYFIAWGGTTNNLAYGGVSAVVADGNWHYVAMNMRVNHGSVGYTGEGWFMVDGVVAAVTNLASLTGTQTSDAAVDLTVGQRGDVSDWTLAHEGNMCGLWLVNGSVTRSEAGILYEETKMDVAGACSPDFLMDDAVNDTPLVMYSFGDKIVWPDWSGNDYWGLERQSSQAGITPGSANKPSGSGKSGLTKAAEVNTASGNTNPDVPHIWDGSTTAYATFEAACYLDSLPGDYAALLNKGSHTTTDQEFLWAVDSSGYVILFIRQATGYVEIRSDSTVSGATWHHVIMYSDGQGVNFGCRIDGVDVGATKVTDTGTGTPSTTTRDLRIAQAVVAGVGDYQWTGDLSFIAIYQSQLSGARMTSHYNTYSAGLGEGCSIPAANNEAFYLSLGTVF
jgi:hypothetical protein